MVKNSTPVPTPPVEPETPVSGKGRSTPTRREREAARKRPLVPDDRKEARRLERERAAKVRERARVGLANGEERYMPVRDRGPQRRFVRDYVDARFSVGELFIPLMFVLIIITFVPVPAVQVYGLLTMYVFVLLGVLDVVILGFILRRKVAAKFGEDKVERGLRWYAAMRALQLRRLRLPKPQVKRGQYPS
ncbi:DUF3043 domain-containing protein [Naasia aerilata]|uniref:DUF3043 domain-containing protein n=1 Tax=Naasia aerilata TaxID=1162966 RepID=UPI0025726C01|nr:DUF3043 domain-containing protein [Naasia aerilata]